MSYLDARYAASMSGFGSPLRLPACQGWVLEREIPGTGLRDAVGCYPLFRCRDWRLLAGDLAMLRDRGLVSLTLVCDPLTCDTDALGDVDFRPYKDHYVVDLGALPDEPGSAHHRRNARRFLRHGIVTECEAPVDHLDAWCRLYDELSGRHGITGQAAFSRGAFETQLALPGARLWRAEIDGCIVGLQLWFLEGELAWHHLSGYDPAGYRWGGASYALMAAALHDLAAAGATTALLGSGAGRDHNASDGLSRFKAGWATGTLPAPMVTAVLDVAAYESLSLGRTDAAFFPAYRAPGADVAREGCHAV